MECSGCGYKWVAVYPVGCTFMECPGCHDAVNEQGTLVLVRRCKGCGSQFTVCPKPDVVEGWENCMAESCPSYDPGRDGDRLFDEGKVKREDDP
jgi:flavoprotein